MVVKKYRKRPIEAEAVQVTAENAAEIAEWITANLDEMHGANAYQRYFFGKAQTMVVEIPTLHGLAEAVETDWVVRGPKGDFWPVRNDIFGESYEDADVYVRRQMVGEPSCGDPNCPCQRG